VTSKIRNTGRHLLRWSWVGLLLWQILWHALLPLLAAAKSHWILAIIALLPLLPFTPGVMKTRHRSLVLAMFVVMIYFVIGVMECWANAEQRIEAIVQILLCCSYFGGLVLFNRPVLTSQE